jgi:hypothetical protein
MLASGITRWVGQCGAISGCAVAVLAAGGGQAPSARVVGEQRGFPVAMFLPILDGSGAESAVLSVAGAAGVSVGVERVPDEPLPPGVRPVPRSPRKVTLSGMTVADALKLITEQAPPLRSSTATESVRFGWREAGDMILVSQFVGRPTFLDTVIDQFEVNDQTVRGAMLALHRRFDPDYPTSPVRGRRGGPPTIPAAFERTFSLSLQHVTTREVLSAIVRAAGDASWVVRYASIDGGYAGCEIAISSSTGIGFSFNARK